jgi:release factor glutamine methyltransferase
MKSAAPFKIVSSLTVREALKWAMQRLLDARVPSHTLAAELLVMYVMDRDRAWIYAHPEEVLSNGQALQLDELVVRRAAGTPTQYLTGKQEFWGLEFHVEQGVLIPRPETEHVIEVALERLGQFKPQRIVDVGTGSGCLAVALAREYPESELYATDVSLKALSIARANAARHSARVQFICCDLLAALLHEPRTTNHEVQNFHLIVSNPPYVGSSDAQSLPREVREHEPAAALFAGEHGAEVYPRLIEHSAALLARGGLLVLELGHDSLPRVYPLLEGTVWHDVRITHDLAGIPRVISAIRS